MITNNIKWTDVLNSGSPFCLNFQGHPDKLAKVFLSIIFHKCDHSHRHILFPEFFANEFMNKHLQYVAAYPPVVGIRGKQRSLEFPKLKVRKTISFKVNFFVLVYYRFRNKIWADSWRVLQSAIHHNVPRRYNIWPRSREEIGTPLSG